MPHVSPVPHWPVHWGRARRPDGSRSAHRQTKPHLTGALTRLAFSDWVVQSTYLDLLLGKYASAWHYGHKKQADDVRALGGNPG
jgi:hypothetical protein